MVFRERERERDSFEFGDSSADDFPPNEHEGVLLDRHKAPACSKNSPGELKEVQWWRARLKTIDPAIAAASIIVRSETDLRCCCFCCARGFVDASFSCFWSLLQSGSLDAGSEAAAAAAEAAAVRRSILIE